MRASITRSLSAFSMRDASPRPSFRWFPHTSVVMQPDFDAGATMGRNPYALGFTDDERYRVHSGPPQRKTATSSRISLATATA